jgi:hypothetical protein
MDRHNFLLTALVSVVVVPLVIGAQPAAKVPRVGYLSPVSAGALGHVVSHPALS